MILYSTPPITFTYLIKQLKKASNAKTYLLLKDIFPQNAVDLDLLKMGGILYKYFRKKEKILYNISDYIGCMSPANLNYVLDKNPEIDKKKLEVNPNSIDVKENVLKFNSDLYNKYKIPKNKVIFIFGGNLGIPQGIDYLKANIEYCKSIKDAFFLIIGDGTEYNKLRNWIRTSETPNVVLIKELPKSEYDDIIKLSHVGLIFLNPHFTIPNFPSRILTYMQNRLPVICATDLVTDIGEIVVNNNFGFKCLTSDKKSFFDHLPKTAFALSNIDDKNGPVLLQNTVAKKCTYALKSYADYKAQILESQLSGLLLKINGHEVWVKLIGTFNAYNLLAIYGTAIELGMESLEALRLLSELESVSGRFQYIVSAANITAIVDYAHTPDALENVLKTINDIRTKNEQLITVVGCGGNRDKTKRPIMGGIASDLSDKAILTSDNPRNEDAEVIISEMEQGVAPQNFKRILSITDRKQAIKTACQLAQPNDIILIAGKGHETYQEINGVRHDFDDMKIVKELLEQLHK